MYDNRQLLQSAFALVVTLSAEKYKPSSRSLSYTNLTNYQSSFTCRSKSQCKRHRKWRFVWKTCFQMLPKVRESSDLMKFLETFFVFGTRLWKKLHLYQIFVLLMFLKNLVWSFCSACWKFNINQFRFRHSTSIFFDNLKSCTARFEFLEHRQGFSSRLLLAHLMARRKFLFLDVKAL